MANGLTLAPTGPVPTDSPTVSPSPSMPRCLFAFPHLPFCRIFGAHEYILLVTQITFRHKSRLSSFCFISAVFDFETGSLLYNYEQCQRWPAIVFRSRGPRFLGDHLPPKELQSIAPIQGFRKKVGFRWMYRWMDACMMWSVGWS